MSLEVETVVLPDYLRVSASGEYTLERMYEFINRVKLEADNAGCDRVLIDPRNVIGNMTEADRFMAGRLVAEVFGPRLKAACVMQPGTVTKLGELTAVNRGANFFVTESETEAVKWLQTD